MQAKATPLPLTQIAILMAVRLAEPIQYTGTILILFPTHVCLTPYAFVLVIFPFINEMVEELHVTEYADRIGYVRLAMSLMGSAKIGTSSDTIQVWLSRSSLSCNCLSSFHVVRYTKLNITSFSFSSFT
jgi:hypothetical protein